MAKRCYGWQRQAHDPLDVMHTPRYSGAKLPVRASTLDKFPARLDQGQTNTCGPNAFSALIQVDEKIGGFSVTPPSRNFGYYITRQEMGTFPDDSGVDNRSMLRAHHKRGYCRESSWPFTPANQNIEPPHPCFEEGLMYLIEDYSFVPQNLWAMCATIAAGRPFLFGFECFSAWESEQVEESGLVPMPRFGETPIGGHDVAICGYDMVSRTFDFVNSYGPTWGMNGVGRIHFDYALNPSLAGDFWVVRSVKAPSEPATARIPRVASLRSHPAYTGNAA